MALNTSALSLHHFPPNPRLLLPLRVSKLLRSLSTSAGGSLSGDRRNSYDGVRLEETVEIGAGKARLDAWISSRIDGVSRGRVQSSIRSGLVSVNGCVVDKVSYTVKLGDKVNCTISELQPLKAEPEDIPLDIKYEDDHVLVINKPPHMVVHPAPGNAKGTLVNAVLHHCRLPTVALTNAEWLSEDDDDINVVACEGTAFGASIRPGIVHRLDKGTSGLLVIAKVAKCAFTFPVFVFVLIFAFFGGTLMYEVIEQEKSNKT